MRPVRAAAAAFVLACAVLLAACGGTTTRTVTRTVASQTTSSTTSTSSTTTLPGPAPKQPPQCTPSNFYMQCAQNAPGQSAPKLASAFSLFGVDSYGATNSGLPAAFDCSYLSGYPGGKDWTSSAIRSWTSRGKTVCFVWETLANRAEYGYGAGQEDAIRARNELAELGVPTYVPIRFAVDTETSAAAVAAYFEGVKSIIGARVGAYGSYYVTAGLEARGITTPRTDWETVAWSYGHRSRACLYQASINHYLYGYSVDYDYASCPDFGQYPHASAKPRTICFGKHAEGNATCRKVHAEIRKWQNAEKASQRVASKRGCNGLIAERNKLNQRWNYFWNALRQHPKVKHAAREKALTTTGASLRKVRRTISGRSCLTFVNRVAYFKARIQTTQKAYS